MQVPWNEKGWSFPTFARILVGCLVVFDLLLVALAAWTLQQARQQYVARAEAVTYNLAQVLEENLRGTVNQVDLGLLATKDEFERRDMPDDRKRLESHMHDQLSRIPILDSIRITDAQGLITRGSSLPSGAQINLSDRDYFQQLKTSPGAELVISQPHIGRVTGKWGIQLARRLNRPDGGFAGVVYGTITLEQLSQTFRHVDVGPHGSISLRGGDLSLLVRFPTYAGSEKLLGDRTITGDYLKAVSSNQSVSHFTVHSIIDDSVRTYTMRRMVNPSFFILIGLSQEDYLQSWRQERVLATLAVVGLIFISIGMMWLAQMAWRRQLQAQAEREGLIQELTSALAEVKNLTGLLPICGQCKKIRDDQGYWNQMETYISEHTEATFSHGVCPDCAQSLREEMLVRREQKSQE
jgi:hypothetical protein